mmetsp:Transcript_10136/g.12844  ORF Transcript_10136/g.12844 Transcript_10136/m.12844 type:complete len:395 (-) Transcript_10136:90-1274(-)
MRTNGLEAPRNGMQITTWILLPLLILQYCFFLTPTLPVPISIPATILFLIFGFCSSYYGYVTTKTDSIDVMLYQHLNNRPHPRVEQIKKRKKKLMKKKKRKKKSSNQDTTAGNSSPVINANSSQDEVEVQNFQEQANPQLDEEIDEEEEEDAKTKYCWVCQTTVHESSMHCKYCDKCVSTFDHHCMWLNNCVGDANYEYFYKTVWFTFLFITAHVITIVIYLSLYFSGNAETKAKSTGWMGAGAPEVVVGFNIGFLVLTSSAAFLVLQLLTFHLGLRREKITTYMFIIRDGQKKREQWQLRQRVRSRRLVEVKRAHEEGKCMEACWLRMGAKWCKCCDPVHAQVSLEIEAEGENENAGVEGNDSNSSFGDEVKVEDSQRPTSTGNNTTKTETTS